MNMTNRGPSSDHLSTKGPSPFPPNEDKIAGKRSRSSDNEEGDPTPEEFSKMSRSERKRHREKKRRNDVNKGFDELMNLLIDIDPDTRAEAEDRTRKGQWKGSSGAQEESVLSRVDLISRTVEVLRRVHAENEERKKIISRLMESSRGSREVVSATERPIAATTESLVGSRLTDISQSLPFPPERALEVASLPSALQMPRPSSQPTTAASFLSQTSPSFATSTSVPRSLAQLSTSDLLRLRSAHLANASSRQVSGVAGGLSDLMSSDRLLGSPSAGSIPQSSTTQQYLQLIQEQQNARRMQLQLEALRRPTGSSIEESLNALRNLRNQQR